MLFRFLQRLKANAALFNGYYVDVKMLYVLKNNEIPSITFIDELDITRAFTYLKETLEPIGVTIYQHCIFDHTDNDVYFSNSILVLKNKRMIELAANYCQILHAAEHYLWVGELVKELAQFRNEKDFASAYSHTHVVGFAKPTEMN